jgi:hypothetical protein
MRGKYYQTFGPDDNNEYDDDNFPLKVKQDAVVESFLTENFYRSTHGQPEISAKDYFLKLNDDEKAMFGGNAANFEAATKEL